MSTTDFPQRRSELRAGYRRLNEMLPAQMAGFGDLHRAAVDDGALPKSSKELMAMAIGISMRCEDCIALHVHAALRAGATAEQVHEAIGVAVLMGGGPASTYAIRAIEALDQFSK